VGRHAGKQQGEAGIAGPAWATMETGAVAAENSRGRVPAGIAGTLAAALPAPVPADTAGESGGSHGGE
jgi:hypothetical protein